MAVYEIMTIFKFAIFFAAGLALLIGGQYLLYRSFVRFFEISNPPVKIILFSVLLFLFLSFIFSSFLIHWWDNSFTRIYYAASAFWLGIVVNLSLAILAIWIISKIGGAAKYPLNIPLLSAGIFFLAIAFSFYGLWNAFNPRIKTIEVQIKNLPDNWKNKTIVQLSDVHLGAIYGEGFLKKTIREVDAIHPDMIVITGDLFDGMDGTIGSLGVPLNDISAPRGIFFVNGNHETYLDLDKALSIISRTKIRVLNDEVAEINGLQIVGVSYPSGFIETRDIGSVIRSMKNFSPHKPSILLYHPPLATDQARLAGINLQLSGHTHHGQIFPIQFISRLIFGKYYYGFHQEGDFSIYTSAGVGTWGPAMRTGNSPEIVAIKLK